MIRLRGLRARYGLVLILIAVIIGSALFLWPRPSPLLVVSSDKKFDISVMCTFGTNHVYYYGDAVDRLFDPAIRRWSNTNAYRLRCQTDEPTTVVWVRLEHPDFAKPPPPVATPTGPVRWPTVGAHRQFRARLMDAGAAETILDLKGSLQHYKGGYYVGGWLLSGSLKDHRGNVLHIESTNGTEVVTFRIP